MFTVLIKDTNEMIITTPQERIMQRSKLVDALHFLVSPTYKDMDMSKFTLLMEYKLPISGECHSEILTLSDELYKEYLEYKVPFDTSLTKECGKIEVQLTFLFNEMDMEGHITQYSRKISPCFINIIPVSAWSNMVPDSELAAIDQRILKLDAIANQLTDTQNLVIDSKADDISYENNTIQLMANGNKIGSSHVLDQQNEFEVVEFDNTEEEDDSDEYTLVEF